MPGVKILWYLGDPFQGAGDTLLLVEPAIWILGYLVEELQGAGKIPGSNRLQRGEDFKFFKLSSDLRGDLVWYVQYYIGCAGYLDTIVFQPWVFRGPKIQARYHSIFRNLFRGQKGYQGSC